MPCLPPGGPPPRVMAFALSLAAGVMIAISGEMLWLPYTEGGTWWRSATLFGVSFGFFAAICALGDWVEKQSHMGKPSEGVASPLCGPVAAEGGAVPAAAAGSSATTEAGAQLEGAQLEAARSARLAVLLFVSLTLHNIPEGFAVAVSAASSRSFGLTVGIAVALHNIPEGLSLAVATYDATKSRLKATLVPALAGCAEPLGALLCIFVMRAFITEQVVNDLLVVVAGVMCYLAFGELLPAAVQTRCWWSALAGCGIGMAVMVATHEMLHHAGLEH